MGADAGRPGAARRARARRSAACIKQIPAPSAPGHGASRVCGRQSLYEKFLQNVSVSRKTARRRIEFVDRGRGRGGNRRRDAAPAGLPRRILDRPGTQSARCDQSALSKTLSHRAHRGARSFQSAGRRWRCAHRRRAVGRFAVNGRRDRPDGGCSGSGISQLLPSGTGQSRARRLQPARLQYLA